MLHPCQHVPLANTQGKFPMPCRGTSGFVQLALDLRTGQEVAIKFIHRGPGAPQFDAQHITRELLNHRMVGRHPNIVQLLEVRPLALLYTRPHSCLLGGEQQAAPRPSGHRKRGQAKGGSIWPLQRLTRLMDMAGRSKPPAWCAEGSMLT